MAAPRPLALEIAALTTFVFARPVLSSLGRSSETFITRGADWTDVLVFLAVVLVVPALALVAVDVAAGLVGRQALAVVHAALVGGLGALAIWQIAGQFVEMSFLPVGGAACALGGGALAVVRYRTQALATFLRYASLIVVVVVAQFVVASPSGSLVLGGRHVGVDPDVRTAVAAAVGDEAPPVVVMVFDGMPTDLMLDGRGAIDADLYPHLADLAATSTWYRNNTTVAPFTLQAVPAILSGRLGDKKAAPIASSHPDNLFTLLGGSYDVHAMEPLTGLCPVSLCPEAPGSPLNDLLGDARAVWKTQMGGKDELEMFVPGAFDDRVERTERWIERQDFGRGERPDAFFVHVLLPHDGWQYLDDGSPYLAADPATGMFAYRWGGVGADVGRQRHILQMQLVDRFVGEVMDELRAAGTFDDAVMVVTADHGYAFNDSDAVRGFTEDNFEQIMWTPLIVKSPGQRSGAVDDRNVQTVDVLPTIADELGVDLDWDLDGVPVAQAERDPADKAMADWRWSPWRSADGGPVEVDGEAGFARVLAADPVPGEGPLALWDRSDGGYGPLVGRSVDGLTVEDRPLPPVDVRDLELWDDVDPGRPPIELLGYTDLPGDAVVAVTVDDTVAAVVPVAPGPYGSTAVHALLWPEALTEGDNEIGVHVLGGTADAPTLTPLRVRAR